ncbi:MAG: DUF6785 family protein [Candidatus Zipacnadales bacterium]
MTLRALILSLIFALATALLVQQVALVYNAGEIESSVPPVPAVFSLLLLALVNPLLTRIRSRWALSRAEILTVYGVVVLTVAMSGRRMVRCLLGFLVAPQYYERLEEIGQDIPTWLAPTDKEMVRRFFEGSPGGTVPWEIWAGPLLAWTALLLVSWLGLFCLISLFQRRWSDQEHLRYPLLYLPLEMSAGSTTIRPTFFRNPIMWIGFAVGFWYALPVVLTPLWEGIPQWKVTLYPFRGIVAPPWSELQSIYFRPLPHLIGLGYLMSTDNLFSIWAGFFAQKLFWVVAVGFGLRRPGWHIGLEHQQAHGAVLVLAAWLLWGHRRALGAMLRSRIGVAQPLGVKLEHIPSPFLLLGALAGFVFAVAWANAAGANWWMATFLFGMLFTSGLVYARIRAETGLPSYWALPFTFEERNFLLDLVNPQVILRAGGLHALSVLSHFGWMTTGQYAQLGAYHIENQRLARVAGLREARMLALSLGAVLAGLLIAYWTHLKTFYTLGALSSVGAGGDGYYEVRWAVGSYQQLLLINSHGPSAIGPNGFRVLGAVIVLVLAALRARFAWFPVTPWGYLIASSYGGTYWGSFFLTWVAQKILLRYGGMTLHTRAVPGFLGLAFGYMAATVAAVCTGWFTGRAFSFAAGRRLYFDV